MAKDHHIKVRYLVPMDGKIKEFFSNIKTLYIDFDVKHIEKNFVTILIVDRKHSLAAELKDNKKNTVYTAIGKTIYLNSLSPN